MLENSCRALEIRSTNALKVKKAIANVVVKPKAARGFLLGNFITLVFIHLAARRRETASALAILVICYRDWLRE